MHAHALPWVDEPLVMKNLLGGDEGLADSGVSVSKLILNPWFFLEATGEVYQGTSGCFNRYERSDVSWVGRLRGYRDVTESTNLDIGGSFALRHNDAGPDFTTRLVGIDATFRYRPLRRAIYRRFMGRTELFWSRRGRTAATPTRSACMRAASTSSRGAGSPAAATTGPSARYDASLVDKGRSLRADVLAERVQPDPRPVPAHALRGGRDGERIAVPVPVLNRRPRRACVLRIRGRSCARCR